MFDPPPQDVVENLVLEPQIQLIIPPEIKRQRLAEQLTGGDIAYIDFEDYETVRLVKKSTWQPARNKHGIEQKLPLSQIGNRRFNAIIFVTPPRTEEDSLEEQISFLAKHLGRKTDRREGTDAIHHSGTLFVVEPRAGNDERAGWRQDQLTRSGLVVEHIKGKKSVLKTDDFIISMGRREKGHVPIDLTKGEISGRMYTDIPDATERLVEDQGSQADTTSVRQESRRTFNPPRTIQNLKRGGNTRYTMMDEDGKELYYEVDVNGNVSSNNPDAFKDIYFTPERETKPQHKPGDKIENKSITCSGCGQHPVDTYIRKPGKTHWLLIKQTVCNGSHSDGYPRTFADEFIRSIGKLPDSMKRTG